MGLQGPGSRARSPIKGSGRARVTWPLWPCQGQKKRAFRPFACVWSNTYFQFAAASAASFFSFGPIGQCCRCAQRKRHFGLGGANPVSKPGFMRRNDFITSACEWYRSDSRAAKRTSLLSVLIWCMPIPYSVGSIRPPDSRMMTGRQQSHSRFPSI